MVITRAVCPRSRAATSMVCVSISTTSDPSLAISARPSWLTLMLDWLRSRAGLSCARMTPTRSPLPASYARSHACLSATRYNRFPSGANAKSWIPT
jgi:hypothetical protein